VPIALPRTVETISAEKPPPMIPTPMLKARNGIGLSVVAWVRSTPNDQ